jgi:group II intron reverse transcriptase/maturase
MQSAATVLGIIRERGRRELPLERIYRQLFNPELYLLAYGRMYRNAGALTPGATPETVDGMSLAKIDAIIEQLRYERYRWTPVRRVYIEKPNSTKKRPLGIPTWSDKLLQEVIRLILEAYYEPQFSPSSHGFRPNRGCHTALTEIYHKWTGTTWFIEGDISQCFDSLDQTVLMQTLGETIHDGRFLRLIRDLLQAGYSEDWKFNRTLSGTPQGGVVSPILANIYLDRLDKYVETILLPAYNHGTQRAPNPTYLQVQGQVYRLRKQGRRQAAMVVRKHLQTLPSKDPFDPGYRRLRYIRYADDVLLGFCGPQVEAEAIKRQLGTFLRDTLKLELSETKTLITHAKSAAARFLGYEVEVIQNNQLRDRRGIRTTNGTIGLRVPVNVVRTKCHLYLRHGKPTHRKGLTENTVFSILTQYQQEYRGLVEYYRLAYNVSTQLNRLEFVMEQSLVRTLAEKLRISVRQVYRRYETVVETPNGPRKVLQVKVTREGKSPVVAQWGGISLKRRMDVVLDDTPRPVWNDRTEVVQRLLAEECELCGAHTQSEGHHIRALKDLQRKGQGERPKWVEVMAMRRRKTLFVCHQCHDDIHAGRADGRHATT